MRGKSKRCMQKYWRKGNKDKMELGSEFHIDLTNKTIRNHNFYHLLAEYDTFYTDYGRTAITLLYRHLREQNREKRGKILLPAYICNSVIEAFGAANVIFYDLDVNFGIEDGMLFRMLESGDFDGGIFFLMHYFGLLQQEETLIRLQSMCREHGITIIEDTTHSLLTKTRTIGDYCIASLRKWVPIPEGAVIYSRNMLPEEWRSLEHAIPSRKIDAMILKQLFLGEADSYRELEGVAFVNEAYRRIFVEEERKIGNKGELCALSDLSAFLLQCEETREIQTARRRNYLLLGEVLCAEGILLYGWDQYRQNIQTQSIVPFTALLYLEDGDRDGFRKYLAQHKIYCAVHWPIEKDEQYDHRNVAEWSGKLISLPVDQRYKEIHMQYLADTIIGYFKNKISA